MSRLSILHLTWPVVTLSVLLTVACLASIVSIGRLQSDLGRSVRSDFARLQAAQQAQIHLREYRVHTIVLAAAPTAVRQAQVDTDRSRLRAAVAELRASSDDPDDLSDLAELEAGWARYESEFGAGATARPLFRTVDELVRWVDARGVSPLLVPCNRIVERSEARTARTSRESEAQTRWAGRGLLVLGLIGPLAGLAGGYAFARGLSRRVAKLSVHVRAVQARLDQEVGAVTLEAAESLADLDRQLGRVAGRVQDVCTRLQDQERDLLRAEQLAAVGHLAAGVAHEIRNPLTGIKMLVEAAARGTPPAPLTPHDLELITDEIGRLERTVQGLLTYAKSAPAARPPQDVRPALVRAAEIVAARAERAGVTIDVAAGDEPLPVRIDPDPFASLLSNLLLNAVDATAAGGRVVVEAGATSDRRVRIAVRDFGPGIPADVAATLFTPFATTKPTGTGLGLAVARQVAADHGGTLTAANSPGGGACFTVLLPRAEDGRAETAHH